MTAMGGRTAAGLVEVTDLYDAFHELADFLWRRFHFRQLRIDEPEIGPPFDELVDQLQVDLFFPACARRVLQTIGVELDPDEMEERLVLADRDGRPLPGAAATFHFHGFDYGEPYDESVENLVVGGDMVPRPRREVRIFVRVEGTDDGPAGTPASS
ncbi:MAG TPA: hypothetical protein VNK43_13425 [Gemmatimonadales bacterium]|nr:hypothetical protein [Gemmatimonadales bacterium]